MIGKGLQGVLVTLDERKSKLRLALPVARKTAEAVTGGLITLLSAFKTWVHTVTFDNGKEFANHEAVAKVIGCKTYFAKPYHSWERGQNESSSFKPIPPPCQISDVPARRGGPVSNYVQQQINRIGICY